MFDDFSNAKRHVRARGSECRLKNAVVQLRDVVIRASDRVVGGHERVEDLGVASRRVPVQEDGEPAGDPVDIVPEQPVKEPERTEGFPDSDFWKQCTLIDCMVLTETQTLRDLITILRSADNYADISQAFNACAGQSTACVAPVRIAGGRAADGPILNYS